MEIKRSTVEKIRIEDINASHRLDPVEVIIENYGDGAGKILISCWGESWTGYWGSMGSTVEEFFQRVDNGYLIGRMANYDSMVQDTDEDADFIRTLILNHRRRGMIDKQEAKEAWDYMGLYAPDRNSLCYGRVPEELKVIEGMDEPWYFEWPRKVNHKYEYLSRILDLVREVIKPDDYQK